MAGGELLWKETPPLGKNALEASGESGLIPSNCSSESCVTHPGQSLCSFLTVGSPDTPLALPAPGWHPPYQGGLAASARFLPNPIDESPSNISWREAHIECRVK